MKIEQQVCTLEQAKQLSELGIAQAFSTYIWQFNQKDNFHYLVCGEMLFEDDYAAFNVAELGLMMPTRTFTYKSPKSKFVIDGENCNGSFFRMNYHTEAEARAAMLIHLLENKLITPKEINERLINL